MFLEDRIKALLATIPALQYRKSFAKDCLDQRLDPFIGKKRGFFVEAGANDGIKQSNTLYFEKYFGWTGLLVEPVPEFASLCRKHRPKCIVEQVALAGSNEVGNLKMRTAGTMSTTQGAFDNCSDYSAMHHIDRARGMLQEDADIREIEVPSRTLSSILDEHKISQIDLLSLDVEGFELQALKGLDFSRHRPEHILVEVRHDIDIDSVLSPVYSRTAVLSYCEFYTDVLYSVCQND